MKTKVIHFATLATVIILSVSACNVKKETHDHTPAADEPAPVETISTPQHETDPEFRKQLGDVFESYAALKDAFVASDAGSVKQQATATLAALDKVDMKLVSGAAHHDWMTHLGAMQQSLKNIVAATAIDTQRASFSTLSNDLYKTIKAFGLSGQTAYYEFCPMAFDNQGAYWLAKEEKIQNPYFGDKMLTCGSVQEVIK